MSGRAVKRGLLRVAAEGISMDSMALSELPRELLESLEPHREHEYTYVVLLRHWA